MGDVSWILIAVVVVAFFFDYTNGFHDAANAIATSIGTRALKPTDALAMAAGLNIVGGIIYPTKVADTMTQIVDRSIASQELVLAALLGAIIWNLITWYYGIPSSSSHALIGSLGGAALAAAFEVGSVHWDRVWAKVLLPTILSPLTGMLLAVLVTTVFYRAIEGEGFLDGVVMRVAAFLLLSLFFTFTLHLVVGETLHFLAKIELPFWTFVVPSLAGAAWILKKTVKQGPSQVNGYFRGLQTLSAGYMALEHGHNDAQKTMGIITLALIAGHALPPDAGVPMWVKLSCAGVIGLGTFSGGKRIIRTMGMRLVKLQPIDGFCAETVAASVIQVAGSLGMPISTTHAITASITGVGATRRISAVRWGITAQILTAWILTLPCAAILAAISYYLLRIIF